MGATIDYAIVITNRYMALRDAMDHRRAVIQALDESFATVLTSGSIMSAAGFLIAEISTDATIGSVGLALGRGTLTSIILVMTVLPQLLLLGDRFLERTTIVLRGKGHRQHIQKGAMRVDGHLRGHVSGLWTDSSVASSAEMWTPILKTNRPLPPRSGWKRPPETAESRRMRSMKSICKRAGALLLALLLCLSLVPAAAAAGTVTIRTLDEFLRFADVCANDSYSVGLTVELETDLDLSGSGFISIPVFCGVFHGNGHTITHYRVEKGLSDGLFSASGGGRIGGLAEIEEGARFCRWFQERTGPSGWCEPGSDRNCTVSGEVDGEEQVGGLVGVNEESGVIRNCTNGAVITGLRDAGGRGWTQRWYHRTLYQPGRGEPGPGRVTPPAIPAASRKLFRSDPVLRKPCGSGLRPQGL